MPLHERIRSDFEGRILDGSLAPGARLPTEAALMQAYDCSRMTVNKALSSLADAGLIDRRKKAGTFVARPRVHSMVLDVPDICAEVRQRGQAYIYRSLARVLRMPQADDADEVSLAGGGNLLQIDGLHIADNVPLSLEHRLVSVAAVPHMADAEIRDMSPGGWLLQHVPWTEAETRISAVAADPAEAGLLEVAAGSPCLSVERRTWRGSDRITYVRQLFPGAAYDMIARFGPAVSLRGSGG